MSNLKYRLSKLVIKSFGDVQFFSSPFFCLLWGDTHYRVKGPETRRVMKVLQEGDILLRRYDRYVSAWFIPGWWTHAAVASSSDMIVHATTKGVVTEDVLSFLRCDHVAVLRYSDKRTAQNAAAMAITQVGKQYDFLFDASNSNNLYCTELVKYCYPGVLDDLGEGTIPPDRLMDVGLEVVHNSLEWRKES